MNQSPRKEGEKPDRTFFCQVDTHQATKDYLRKGRCVRLIGVEQHQYLADELSRGVDTFTIDLDFWEFPRHVLALKYWREFDAQRREEMQRRDNDPEAASTWYRIELEVTQHSNAYFYPTFSEDEPTFVMRCPQLS